MPEELSMPIEYVYAIVPVSKTRYRVIKLRERLHNGLTPVACYEFAGDRMSYTEARDLAMHWTNEEIHRRKKPPAAVAAHDPNCMCRTCFLALNVVHNFRVGFRTCGECGILQTDATDPYCPGPGAEPIAATNVPPCSECGGPINQENPDCSTCKDTAVLFAVWNRKRKVCSSCQRPYSEVNPDCPTCVDRPAFAAAEAERYEAMQAFGNWTWNRTDDREDPFTEQKKAWVAAWVERGKIKK